MPTSVAFLFRSGGSFPEGEPFVIASSLVYAGFMNHDAGNLESARAYLRESAAVRQALGVDALAELEPEPLGVGEHNLNYRFRVPGGRAFVLRVNVASQPFHDNQVAYEFAALQALASSGCTPLPIFLDDSAEAPGKGVLVETFCEGAELDFDNLKPGDVDCAVQLMADVHAVPVRRDCPLHRPQDPLRALFEECLQRFELYRASTCEEPRITRWVERFIASAQDKMCATEPTPADCAHIVNTEPLPSHFLLSADGAADAFIDWERPVIGEPAQDVAYFTAPTTTFWDSEFMFPDDQVDAVVESYWRAVDGRFERGDFDARFRAYRAMTALRSATWCCRALITYGSADAHRTGKTARKLPAYLSDDFMARIAQSCFA